MPEITRAVTYLTSQARRQRTAAAITPRWKFRKRRTLRIMAVAYEAAANALQNGAHLQ